MFTAYPKRSNCARHALGLRRGDATLLKQFLLYRTYHGSAMSIAVQARLDRRLERRRARAREPAPVRREVTRGPAADREQR
jgi:hypothetical protein